jgi:replicative DNA helicase
MKTLLRSTFIVRPEDDKDLFLRNFQALNDAELGFPNDVDRVIWKYIQDFVRSHHHVPAFSTLRGHFVHLNEDEIVDRLETLSLISSRSQGDFKKLLDQHVQDRKTEQTARILTEAATIVKTGLPIKGERGKPDKVLRGPVDASRYVMDLGHEVVAPSSGIRLSGEVTSDTHDFRKDYDRRENDPLSGIGQFTGIAQIDGSIRGAKRGELWTHAAFTGGLKSTFALNWAYNQAVYYKHSILIFSLEMPYTQCRRILYAIHSGHEKFAPVRTALGIGRSLSYQRVRDGELDQYSDAELDRMDDAELAKLLPNGSGKKCINPKRPEYKFLFDHVMPDLDDPNEGNGYGSIYIEVADPDKSDFTVPDLRARAELIYAKDPDMACIYVDHAGLMAPRHQHRNTTENLNEVLRDLKRLAMTFNRGLGIAIIALFQISRKGYDAAEKTGRYNLTHLSYANEAERSSDIVTTTFVDDELRGRSLVRFQCLKSRDDEPFSDFFAGVLWICRRMFTCHDVAAEEAKQAGDNIDLLEEDG